MGSAILAYSAMRRAKDLFPQTQLLFWIFKRNTKSVEILDIISKENIITIRDDNFFVLVKDVFNSLSRIWKENIDVVIDMELFSRFSSILSYLTGAKNKVGFYKFYQEGLYRGNLLDKKVYYNPCLHISKNFMALVESLKDSSEDVSFKGSLSDFEIKLPVFQSRAEEIKTMQEHLKNTKTTFDVNNKLIIMNSLTSQLLPLRSWPIKNYISLAKIFLKDEKNFVIIIGLEIDSKDRNIMHDIVRYDRCINLVGKTSTRDLLNLFYISDLFVSHDSGAVHLASLTKIPIIALFGPETPLCYKPLRSNIDIVYSDFACSPCVSAYNHRHSACKDNKCLQVIGVEEIHRLAKKYFRIYDKRKVLHKNAWL